MKKSSCIVFFTAAMFILGIGEGIAQSNLGQPRKTVPPTVQPNIKGTAPLGRTGPATSLPMVLTTGKLTAYGKPPIVMTTEKLTVYGQP